MKSTQKCLFIKVKKIFRHDLLLKISVYLWLVINCVCLKVQQKETGTFTGQYKKQPLIK